LTAGLEHARGDAVISMDADLQHPPEIISQLLSEWQAGFDVVITVREEDERLGWFKRFSSRTFYRLMKWFSDTEIRFAASDFRLLSRRALQALLKLDERHRFVRGLVQWIGFPIKEIMFRPNERCAGVSKYTLRRMLRLAGDGLFSFSRVPLRAPLWAGSVFFGLALLHALLGLIGLGHGTASWHYLLLVVNLGIGSMLWSIGIVGEYVGRVHEQVKGRPIYLLKECRLPASEETPAMSPVRRDAA
jgi:dolichol-phosphate mannosyltransferase